MYVYFYSLYVSGSNVSIIRRINCIYRKFLKGRDLETPKLVRPVGTETRLSIIFANNQRDAQLFFVYVYFYSLHVSGSHVSIIRRTISKKKLKGEDLQTEKLVRPVVT